MRRTQLMLLFATACGDGAQAPGTIVTVAGTGEAAYAGDGKPALESPLYSPLQVFFEPDGTTLIVDWNNLRVRALTETGLQTVLGTGLEGNSEPNQSALTFALFHAYQFDCTSDGQIYFAGYHDPRVLKVDAGVVRLVAGFGGVGNSGDGGPAALAFLAYPTGVAVAADGSVFISDEGNDNVRRVSQDGTIDRVAGTSSAAYSGDGGPALQAGLRHPTRMDLDAEGNLFICDTGNHAIRKIDPDGVITTVAGNGTAGYTGDGGPATDANLNLPRDVAVHPDGGLLIADTGNHAIRYVSPSGEIRTIAGDGSGEFRGDAELASRARLRGPHGVTVAADGSLWIADTYNHRIRRVEPPYLEP